MGKLPIEDRLKLAREQLARAKTDEGRRVLGELVAALEQQLAARPTYAEP